MNRIIIFNFIILNILLSIVVITSSPAFSYNSENLLSEVDASFIGENGEDQSGVAVDIVGDVNGDGYDDIMIGANDYDDKRGKTGKVYLIFGKYSNWIMDFSLSNADASFIGENENDLVGSTIAGVNDVNGDGYNDILIGSPNNKEGGQNAGQVYLIFGKPSGWVNDFNLSNVDASFIGEHAGDYAYRISSVGDVNGDGFNDFVIGADSNDEIEVNGGQTYLIFGKTSGWTLDTRLSNSDASFIGEKYKDLSGHSITGAGDVNGDGFDDILIGSYSQEGTGKAYLIFGKADNWSMDVSLTEADVSFYGEQGSCFGCSVAGLDDVNGDGYDDILIGAYESGKAFLIFGTENNWTQTTDFGNANVIFIGEGNFGFRVAAGGDIDGDGFYDIIIGAHDYMKQKGKTYIFLGKASGWPPTIDAGKNLTHSFIGEEIDDVSAYSIAGAGDVNGDGNDDILIGAPGNDEGDKNAGQTYLIFPKYIPNNPPHYIPIPDQKIVLGSVFKYQITSDDPDGDSLFYYLVEALPNMTINGKTGELLFTPTVPYANQTITIIIALSDMKDDIYIKFNITIIDPLPSFILKIGPIITEENDEPVKGSDVFVELGGQNHSGITDNLGIASIELPGSWIENDVNIIIIKKGYKNTNFTGIIIKNGTYKPSDGSYPKLERKDDNHDGRIYELPLQNLLWITVTVSIMLIIGIVIVSTEIGIFNYFSFFSFLYTRIEKEKILDNFTRGRIYGHICENPGLSFNELKNRLSLSNGTLTYHLKALMKKTMIKSHCRGTKKIFFSSGMKNPENYSFMTKLQKLVYNIIKYKPGISQKQISKESGINTVSVNRIVHRLKEMGLIRIIKGKKTKCYLVTD